MIVMIKYNRLDVICLLIINQFGKVVFYNTEKDVSDVFFLIL
jgi:hypothetical protein